MNSSRLLLLIPFLLLTGCAALNRDDPGNVERDFGQSVRTMIDSQKVTPPAGYPYPASAESDVGDGEVAVGTIRRLRRETQ